VPTMLTSRHPVWLLLPASLEPLLLLWLHHQWEKEESNPKFPGMGVPAHQHTRIMGSRAGQFNSMHSSSIRALRWRRLSACDTTVLLCHRP
jgi:hypothetical protein